MKKDAYYFSHDANSQDDPKCMILIDQLGMEGYGIFWGLIEKLRSEKDYKLPLIVCSSFAKRWGTSKEKVEAVVKSFNLFVIENDEFFYSERLKLSMEAKSANARKSIVSRWENTKLIRANTTVLRNDTIKVNESKVKESKTIGKKVSFENSEIFDKKKFKEYFSNWNIPKLQYYHASAIAYSAEGNKYIDWGKALSNWAKRDELQGKIKFEQPKNNTYNENSGIL